MMGNDKRERKKWSRKGPGKPRHTDLTYVLENDPCLEILSRLLDGPKRPITLARAIENEMGFDRKTARGFVYKLENRGLVEKVDEGKSDSGGKAAYYDLTSDGCLVFVQINRTLDK